MKKPNEIKEDFIINNFYLVNEIDFARMASHSHMYQVNSTQARLLNIKYGVDIYWCSIKKDGEEFDSYLAEFGFPGDKNYWIGEKLFQSKLRIFQELDPNYGTGVDYY